jgi:hypothetical protein
MPLFLCVLNAGLYLYTHFNLPMPTPGSLFTWFRFLQFLRFVSQFKVNCLHNWHCQSGNTIYTWAFQSGFNLLAAVPGDGLNTTPRLNGLGGQRGYFIRMARKRKNPRLNLILLQMRFFPLHNECVLFWKPKFLISMYYTNQVYCSFGVMRPVEKDISPDKMIYP